MPQFYSQLLCYSTDTSELALNELGLVPEQLVTAVWSQGEPVKSTMENHGVNKEAKD